MVLKTSFLLSLARNLNYIEQRECILKRNIKYKCRIK